MSVLMNYGVNTNISGTNGWGRQPPNANGTKIGSYNTLVAETTDTAITVPSEIGIGQLTTDKPKILVILGYQAESTVFVADQTPTNGVTTAAPDTSGAFVAKPGIINPGALIVNGGDILHFYPIGAAAFVSIEFWTVT